MVVCVQENGPRRSPGPEIRLSYDVGDRDVGGDNDRVDNDNESNNVNGAGNDEIIMIKAIMMTLLS